MKDAEVDRFISLLLSIDQKLQILVDSNFMVIKEIAKINKEPLSNYKARL